MRHLSTSSSSLQSPADINGGLSSSVAAGHARLKLNCLLMTLLAEWPDQWSMPCLQKFGVEGCEALLPGLREAARVSADEGATELFVGMPHRGRLNVLCTLLQKPPGALFAQMNNAQSQYHVGDVKYHLGQSGTLDFPTEVRGRA